MSNELSLFLDSVSPRGSYCLGCLSEMYGEPAKTVTGYLSEIGISGRLGTCANCDEEGSTFRSDRSF
jgi:hypothetical protein